MATFISIISHGHSELINRLSCLPSLCDSYKVVVKSNKPHDCFKKLSLNENFYWLDELYYLGFGHNNNIVFDYCQTQLCMSSDDYFIVLNPDVVISAESVESLIHKMKAEHSKVAAINLFKDKKFKEYDNSIRQFPTLLNLTKSFLGLGNKSILDKNKIQASCNVDWAAGSFLSFLACHYQRLGGFDENYFMYCEDIDICYRSSLLECPVTYYPDIIALHLAKHENRKILSKHFYWHLFSALRFILTKYGFTKSKSSLSNIN